ncbi:MAG: hypothetical protein AAFQ80_25515 [Cyanobacteria bacterium J06621_8]
MVRDRSAYCGGSQATALRGFPALSRRDTASHIASGAPLKELRKDPAPPLGARECFPMSRAGVSPMSNCISERSHF